MKHRIRAAGLVFRDDAILLIRHRAVGGDYWVPPGGGLEPEDRQTRDTVIREVHEESGLTVRSVGPLVYVREFRETSANTFHFEQFYWVSDWSGELHLGNLQGLGGDEHLIEEARFVPRVALENLNVYPRELRDDVWDRIQQNPLQPKHLGTQEEGIDAQC